MATEPHEAAAWFADEFTFEDVAALHGLADHEVARRWRELGYIARRTRELLLADRDLTPEEARAFDAARLDPEVVVRWVVAGFSATDARAFADLDVLPEEARVWRWARRGPEDARRQREPGVASCRPVSRSGGSATARDERSAATPSPIRPGLGVRWLGKPRKCPQPKASTVPCHRP